MDLSQNKAIHKKLSKEKAEKIKHQLKNEPYSHSESAEVYSNMTENYSDVNSVAFSESGHMKANDQSSSFNVEENREDDVEERESTINSITSVKQNRREDDVSLSVSINSAIMEQVDSQSTLDSLNSEYEPGARKSLVNNEKVTGEKHTMRKQPVSESRVKTVNSSAVSDINNIRSASQSQSAHKQKQDMIESEVIQNNTIVQKYNNSRSSYISDVATHKGENTENDSETDDTSLHSKLINTTVSREYSYMSSLGSEFNGIRKLVNNNEENDQSSHKMKQAPKSQSRNQSIYNVTSSNGNKDTGDLDQSISRKNKANSEENVSELSHRNIRIQKNNDQSSSINIRSYKANNEYSQSQDSSLFTKRTEFTSDESEMSELISKNSIHKRNKREISFDEGSKNKDRRELRSIIKEKQMISTDSSALRDESSENQSLSGHRKSNSASSDKSVRRIKRKENSQVSDSFQLRSEVTKGDYEPNSMSFSLNSAQQRNNDFTVSNSSLRSANKNNARNESGEIIEKQENRRLQREPKSKTEEQR